MTVIEHDSVIFVVCGEAGCPREGRARTVPCVRAAHPTRKDEFVRVSADAYQGAVAENERLRELLHEARLVLSDHAEDDCADCRAMVLRIATEGGQ